MKVFLSYSRPDERIADDITMRLIKEGDTLFLDRDTLPKGQEFDNRIREEINSCDFLVFLISPHSVADGSYSRTELKFARSRWPHPEGHVLPVMVSPTPLEDIPAYLRAITILEPEGNLIAEVAVEMQRHRAVINNLEIQKKAGEFSTSDKIGCAIFSLIGIAILIKQCSGS